jgi:hypothetical protein
MAKYIITMKCRGCGHKWKRKTHNPESADPPCPNLDCGLGQDPIGMDLTWNKAPAAIGGSNTVKAIDETARIVMEDQGFTNLRDDVRQGETMEPAIPAAARAAADAFFGGGESGRRGMPVLGVPGMTMGDLRGNFRPDLAAARAMHGSLSDPVSTRRSIGPVEGRPRASVPHVAIVDDRTGTR